MASGVNRGGTDRGITLKQLWRRGMRTGVNLSLIIQIMAGEPAHSRGIVIGISASKIMGCVTAAYRWPTSVSPGLAHWARREPEALGSVHIFPERPEATVQTHVRFYSAGVVLLNVTGRLRSRKFRCISGDPSPHSVPVVQGHHQKVPGPGRSYEA